MTELNTSHGRRGSTIEHNGVVRLVAARGRYPSPVEPGTIVGPRDITREHLVALTTTPDGVTLFGWATSADLAASLTHAFINGSRSVAEHRNSRLGVATPIGVL